MNDIEGVTDYSVALNLSIMANNSTLLCSTGLAGELKKRVKRHVGSRKVKIIINDDATITASFFAEVFTDFFNHYETVDEVMNSFNLTEMNEPSRKECEEVIKMCKLTPEDLF